MTTRVTFHLALSTLLIVVCSCRVRQNVGEQEIPASDLRVGRIQDPALVNLAREYQAAQDQFARRAVCLRAIDEAVIQRGASVSAIDGIFGTDFASDLPAQKGTNRKHWILFADQPSPLPKQDGMQPAVGYVGWHLDFEYGPAGKIQNYRLSNLHKGLSSRLLKK